MSELSRRSGSVPRRVRINDRDPFHAGKTGVVESHRDHYLVVRLDDEGGRPIERMTVHESGVTDV